MSDELPDDIKRIITAQTQRNLPKTVILPVLPKIGQPFGQSSSAPLPRTILPVNSSGPLARSLNASNASRSIAEQSGRSIAVPVIPQFDYSHIPDHELLRSTVSTAQEDGGGRRSANALTTELDRTFVIPRTDPSFSLASAPFNDSIAVLDLVLAPIPTSLPVIPGLQTAIDNLSDRRVQSILDACRLYDREQRGYLSVPSMIKCIGEVVTSVHSPNSPWRLLLNSMAPRGEFIEYKRLFDLIQKERQPEVSEETISELLTPLELDDATEFSFKPSTGQESRQRSRAQVMAEIETLLTVNPELSLDRLKTATTQKVIEQSEFKMLLEMYGLEEPFRPFYQRLISCFLTHNNKFQFSAFVGCLALVRPPLRPSASAAPIAPWNKAPLDPITAKHNN